MRELTTAQLNQLVHVIECHPCFQSKEEREAFLFECGLDQYMPSLHLELGTIRLIAGKLVRDMKSFGRNVFAQFLRGLTETLRDPETLDRKFLYTILLEQEMEIPAYGSMIDLHAAVRQESSPDPTLFRSVGFFKRALLVGRSVARLRNSAPQQGNVGTGFLVGTSCILTNQHVIPNAAIAQQTTFWFNYELDESYQEAQPEEYRMQTNGIFVANEHLDYALIEIADHPGKRWGVLPLRDTIPVDIDERINIIQHPGGQHKVFACIQNRLIGIQDNDLIYTTPTEPGSSGSPVFNDGWDVIGLHFQGDLRHVDGKPVARNRGKRIAAILQSLPSHVRSLLV